MNGHLSLSDIEPKPADDFPNGSGLYQGVAAERYHGLGGRASSTVLRAIKNKSPAHAKAKMDDETEPSSSMRLGTMLHEAILEPATFNDNYAVSTQCWATTSSGSQCSSPGKVPYWTEGGTIIWFCGRSSHQPDMEEPIDVDCEYCDADPGDRCVTKSGNKTSPHATRKAKAHLHDTVEGPMPIAGPADVDVLTEDRADQIGDMRQALRSSEKANLLLYELEGINELTALWEHSATGVPCKSRIDRVVHHEVLGTVAVDYKTTRNAEPGPHGFGRSAMKHRYDMQAAFYLEALAQLGIPTDNFVFVAQEKSPPYDVVSYVVPTGPDVGRSLMEKGREDMLEALEKYRWCAETNTWPGYTGEEDQIYDLEVPHWHYD